MGKASRILKENLAANHAKDNKKYKEYADQDMRDKVPDKTADILYSEKVYDTSNIIKDKLVEYSQTCGIPICEYLNIQEIENYLKWMYQSQVGTIHNSIQESFDDSI
jgi:hypothetical protein